jgi:hypothetical protein
MNYHKLVQYIGPFEVFEDYNTHTKVFRLSDGTTYHVPHIELAGGKSDLEVFRYLVNLMSKKQVEEAKQYLIENNTGPKAKRIEEINAELDILRGVVPTPANYNFEPSRAKELMAELKRLLK